jgi:hypothetical protein
MQTVSEAMFDLKGLDSTRFFLSHYVDGADADKKFSAIADEIHVARNVLAHQGYSSLQHQVEYFSFEIKEGWKKDNTGTVHINPSVYAQLFLEAITNHKYVSEYEKESTEVRAVRKYRFIRKWLSVDKNNPISQEILKLDGLTGQDFQKQEAVVQRTILNSYKVT